MLRGLEEVSLLERGAQGRYSMHDLIRRHASDTAHHELPDHVRTVALRRVVDFYLHTADAADRLLAPDPFHSLRGHRRDRLAVWQVGLASAEHLTHHELTGATR